MVVDVRDRQSYHRDPDLAVGHRRPGDRPPGGGKASAAPPGTPCGCSPDSRLSGRARPPGSPPPLFHPGESSPSRAQAGVQRAARLRPPLASGDPLPQPRSSLSPPLRNVAVRRADPPQARGWGGWGGVGGAGVIRKWDCGAGRREGGPPWRWRTKGEIRQPLNDPGRCYSEVFGRAVA